MVLGGRRVRSKSRTGVRAVFRSDDGGENWMRVSANRLLRQRAWYYSTITVHPTNPNEVWCPQVQMLKSLDGGMNFQIVKGISHGDNHDLWIDPQNPKRILPDKNDSMPWQTAADSTYEPF